MATDWLTGWLADRQQVSPAVTHRELLHRCDRSVLGTFREVAQNSRIIRERTLIIDWEGYVGWNRTVLPRLTTCVDVEITRVSAGVI